MNKTLLKDCFKEIKNTFKRFLSLVLIVLLGVGFFAGIKATSPVMQHTVDTYLDELNTMDIEVISTLGLTNSDIEELSKIDGVESIESAYSADAIVETQDIDLVVKLYTMPEKINTLKLIEGSLPKNENECVIEENFLKKINKKVGDTIELSPEKIKDDEGNEKDLLKQSNMKIVGTIESPLYISHERGSSKLGSGTINYYMFVPKEIINTDIYTEIYLKVANTQDLNSFGNEYENKVKQIKSKIEDIQDARKEARYNEVINTANAKIEDAQKTLDEEKKKAEDKIQDAQNQIDSAKKKLSNAKAEITANEKKANTELASAEKQFQEAQAQLDAQKKALNNPLEEQQAELDTKKAQLAVTKKQTQTQLAAAKKEVTSGETKVKQNQQKLTDARKEADEKIADAQTKLDDAKEKLKDIKKPEWYILTRSENQGIESYKQDTQRIENIAKVFPVIFFIVAALISLTSMTRMVEEQRIQIGGLKALGYNKIQIASKYILYALLATTLGSAIGVCIGFGIIPKIVYEMYQMMYTTPNVTIEFNLEYAIMGFGIAILCTCGATIYTCIKELNQMPAVLMRPKSPKMGKRVLLERIPFIWKRLKFSRKVTVRNIFRYKKRFLMTIIGILGCTSLIVAGFGLRDSISNMIPAQYGQIFKYDTQIDFKDSLSQKEIDEKTQTILDKEEILKLTKINMQSVTVNDSNQTIQIIVPESYEELKEFITVKQRTKSEIFELNDEEIIITEKIAKLLNAKPGDIIKIKNTDDIIVEAKIGKIAENYLRHYIYMSPTLYKNLFNEELKYNAIFTINNNLTEQQEDILGKEILNTEGISGVTFTSNIKGIFDDVMKNMTMVVWILIISAGMLAFVVLYNLANVNISERIRELATIKVLGFYDKEVYKYVSRETVILTIIGILLGLVGGYFLNMFILQTAELDMLMFDKRVELQSYIYGIVITIAFTLIVNIITYFSLKKIDMIESLKSVE